jgi:N-acetyl-anhydromuramyl-L-alanine amidase AmpD
MASDGARQVKTSPKLYGKGVKDDDSLDARASQTVEPFPWHFGPTEVSTGALFIHF